MTLSLYDLSLPVFDQALANLDHVLKKGEAHAKAHDIAPEALLTARLYPDMFTLIGQVQVATSLAKNCPYRLTGTQPPQFDTDETSFADCYATIERARAEMAKFSADDINGNEAREFSVALGPMGDVPFVGLAFAQGFVVPNVFFHCTTAYNILRHNGVPLGKMDFFGSSTA